MNKEELIQKLLEKDINADEAQEIELLQQSDPDFSAEVRDLSRLENNLHSLKTTIVFQDLDFINTLGQSLANSVSNAGSGIGSAKAAGLMTKLMSKANLIGMSIITSVAVITGGTALYFSEYTGDEKTDLSNTSKKEIVLTNEPAKFNISEAPVTENADIKQNDILINDKEQGNKLVADNIKATQSSDEVEVSINQKNKTSNAEMINKLKSELDAYLVSNDLLNAALTQKRLGVLISQTGNIDLASQYFESSIGLSVKMKNISMECESLGEFGIALIKSGDSDKGVRLLEKCVDKLQSKGLERAEFWKKILDSRR